MLTTRDREGVVATHKRCYNTTMTDKVKRTLFIIVIGIIILTFVLPLAMGY